MSRDESLDGSLVNDTEILFTTDKNVNGNNITRYMMGQLGIEDNNDISINHLSSVGIPILFITPEEAQR
jgi:hypothetical protein